MKSSDELTLRFEKQKIDLVSGASLNKTLLIFGLLILVILSLPLILLITKGIDREFWISTLFVLPVLFFVVKLGRKLGSVSLKGDTVVYRTWLGEKRVGTLKCIRNFSSIRLGLFCYTKIDYAFDGRKYQLRLITNRLKHPYVPEELLRKALSLK